MCTCVYLFSLNSITLNFSWSNDRVRERWKKERNKQTERQKERKWKKNEIFCDFKIK